MYHKILSVHQDEANRYVHRTHADIDALPVEHRVKDRYWDLYDLILNGAPGVEPGYLLSKIFDYRSGCFYKTTESGTEPRKIVIFS